MSTEEEAAAERLEIPDHRTLGEPERCGDTLWPSRPDRSCMRHLGHKSEHENRYGATWISPSRALAERREQRRLRAERDEARADLARALPVVEAAGAYIDHLTATRPMAAEWLDRRQTLLDALALAVQTGGRG